MIDDLRLDAIAAATRQRDGDAAVTLTGLMLAEEAGEAIQQLRRLLDTPASRRGRTRSEQNSQTSSSPPPSWRAWSVSTCHTTSTRSSRRASHS